MKNYQNSFVTPLVIGISAILLIGLGVHYYSIKNGSTNTSVAISNSDSNSNANPALKTYDNSGIAFQYPAEWGIPNETLYGGGLANVYFNNASDSQMFIVSIEQDTNPQGTGLLNETLDQMVARYRKNDKYIYQVQNVIADGISGRELFYNSAVTGQPYHVTALFPFKNNSYLSIDADYESVPQNEFDTILSSLKWDDTTAFKMDQGTGLVQYKNNGIQFQYPAKLNTDYAELSINTSVEKIDATKLDSNGCYSTVNNFDRPGSSTVLIIGGIKFCSATGEDVGAGQANTTYSYMTLHNGNVYTINYLVGTSNGCAGYQDSLDLTSPENQKYNECLDAQKNFATTVVKPIQDSISTFMFTR